jgi:hypothetical protein
MNPYLFSNSKQIGSRSFLLLVLLTLFAFTGYAQKASEATATNVYQKVAAKQANGADFTTYELFNDQSKATADAYAEEVSKGTTFDYDFQKGLAITQQNPESFKLKLPALDGEKAMEINLVKSNIFTADFKVYTNDGVGKKEVKYERGLHYHGVIDGKSNSLAAISIFADQVMGVIYTDNGTYNLAKLEDSDSKHIFYKEQDLVDTRSLDCSTEDDGKGYTAEQLNYAEKDVGDCIRIYVESDYSVTLNKGSVAAATNYVTGLFNQSFVLYANETISMAMSELFVWSVNDPYTGPSSSQYRSQFQSAISSINGDLGHLVAMVNNGGIAAGFSGLCNADVDQSLCYSGILSTYQNVPVYSFTVLIVTHEMGHLIGSRHTHACVWNGNNTAIDGCSGFTEGPCPVPPSPVGGGTIMSYCHNDPVGVDFTQGFGPQPGNVIRASLAAAPCLSPCGGPVVPANDLCTNAAPISCGQTLNGTTTNATFDNVGTCVTTNTGPGVWYSFVGGGTTTTLSTCNQATFDTKISVFNGSCGSLSCVAGNDDGGGCSGFTSEVSFPTVAGVTYYVLVHGFGTAEGDFSLTMECGSSYTMLVDYNANCWEDISGTGTLSTVTNDDDNNQPNIPLGFSFPFYGASFTEVNISTNGNISFGTSDYLGLANTPIPSTTAYSVQNYFIAGCWDDLNPGTGGDIYYQSFGTYFIVQFEQVNHFSATPSTTFQFIIYNDGNIVLNYKDVGGSAETMGSGATVGIQKDPTTGIQFSYNAAVLANGLQVAFLAQNAPTPPCVQNVDTTPPMITCPATQYENLDANCEFALADYTSLATVTDDTDPNPTVTQSPTPGTVVNGETTTTVTLVATDASGNSTSCTFDVVTQDATPPSAVCLNNTVYLEPDGTYTLQDIDVLDFGLSDDNCNFYVSNIAPAVVDCDDFNTTVPVSVTVSDDAGNTDNCTANINVQKGFALPIGWDHDDIGTASGDAYYDPCEMEFTVESNGFSTGTNDKIHMAYTYACGPQAEIIAHIQSVDNNGFAGIMFRESTAAGARKVALKTQLSTFVRSDIRMWTNGPSSGNQIFRPMDDWLKITRTGNTFMGYTSSNGVNWTFAFVTNVSMSGCVNVGLFTEGPNSVVTSTAVFDNVSVSGGSPVPLTDDNNGLTADQGKAKVSVFPNPAQSEINVNLEDFVGQNAKLTLYNSVGQALKLIELDQVAFPTQTIELNGFEDGLYLIEIRSGDAIMTRKFVVSGN